MMWEPRYLVEKRVKQLPRSPRAQCVCVWYTHACRLVNGTTDRQIVRSSDRYPDRQTSMPEGTRPICRLDWLLTVVCTSRPKALVRTSQQRQWL